MNCKCHGSGCEKEIVDNHYCEECYNELQNQKQKQEQKPKVNEAKLIHQNIFG
jgi:hypothetical protein